MESARSRVSLLGAIALVLSVASPSQAENCDAIPCKCGDTITVDRTLTSADPVTGLPVCSGTGLFVDGSDLTLNMGSQQLRGENKATVNQTGIVVLPGHTNVTVIDGRLSGFTRGVSGGVAGLGGGITGSNFSDLLIIRAAEGVVVFGDGNKVQRSEIKALGSAGTLGRGVAMLADDGRVFLNRIERYTTGIHVEGSGVRIDRNLNYYNGTGIRVVGTEPRSLELGSHVELNRANYGTGNGIELAGLGAHTASRNQANANTGDGFLTTAGDSLLKQNTANSNRGFGFRDTTTGAGTSGTDNLYTANRCATVVARKSSPAGLCR